MAVPLKSRSFFLYLLLIFHILSFHVIYANTNFDNSDEDPQTLISHTPNNNICDLDVLNQQVQIEKLEQVVENLTQVVWKLESLILKSTKAFGGFDGKEKNPIRKKAKTMSKDGDSVSNVRGGAVSITKHSLFWSERFQFLSAVKLDSSVTCVIVLSFKDSEGLSKYVAVGNDEGKVYVFSRNGNVLVEFSTLSRSPVITMLSYMSSYNQSVLVTGHENGNILMHSVSELSTGEEGNALLMDSDEKFVAAEIEEGGPAITILEIHNVGRTRYILSTDASGKIRVFREDGSLHGLAVPMSRPLAFLRQKLLFLTETGAGSLDLRTMRLLETGCEGLNHSVVSSYVFDAIDRSKAYGCTSEGDLIHVLLLGDVTNFKCRVRYMKKSDMDAPRAIQTMKGYLLVSNREKVFVYNVSSPHYVRYGGPRFLFSSALDEIVASFLNYQVELDAEKKEVIPLIASDQEKLIILSLGSGYVGVYGSNLPIFRVESSSMIWGTPLVVLIILVFGAWKFFANNKEVFASWGPEDPFTSTSITEGNEALLDRSFMDSSSRSEITDLRSSGLRGPSRKYGSPSLYTGGTTISFRPNSADTNYRPASVDPNYRTTSELIYRGSNLEPAIYSHGRENVYGNSPILDVMDDNL